MAKTIDPILSAVTDAEGGPSTEGETTSSLTVEALEDSSDETLLSDLRVSVGDEAVVVEVGSWTLEFREPFMAHNELRAEVVATHRGVAVHRRLMSLHSARDRRRLTHDLQQLTQDLDGFAPSIFHIAEDELEPFAEAPDIRGDGTVGPWPSPVDGPQVAQEVVGLLARYLYLSDVALDTIALWVMGAWVIDELYRFAILALLSPSKRCGKSTALAIISKLVRRPLLASSVTPAALYNAIAESTPTLLIDEADVLFARRQTDLVAVLNAGHTRGGEVLRASSSGDSPSVRRYPVFSAKCLAAIGRLPSTVEDRSVVITMDRLPHGTNIEPLRTEQLEAQGLRTASRLCRWGHDFGESVGDQFPDVPPELGLREADNWRPLLAVAAVLGQDWPERAWRAAVALSGRPTDDQDPNIELLSDVRDVLVGTEDVFISTAELIDRLVRIDESRWADMGSRRLTARKLALLLAPFGIRSQQPRRGAARGFFKRQFEEAWLRYLRPDASDASGP